MSSDVMSSETGDEGKNEQAVETKMSAKLFAPTFVLSCLLLFLASLPMSSCDYSQDGEFIPLRATWNTTTEIAQDSQTAKEAWSRLSSVCPTIFALTMPYWLAFPAIIAFPFLFWSARKARSVWRCCLLILATSISLIAFSDGDLGSKKLVIGAIGFAAVCSLLWSSPTVASFVSWRIGFAKSSDNPLVQMRRPVIGGFLANTIVCIAATVYFVLVNHLLYGGKLAAMTCIVMSFTSVISARQARTDPSRWPQFNTRDLLLLTTMITIAVWWFWSHGEPTPNTTSVPLPR